MAVFFRRSSSLIFLTPSNLARPPRCNSTDWVNWRNEVWWDRGWRIQHRLSSLGSRSSPPVIDASVGFWAARTPWSCCVPHEAVSTWWEYKWNEDWSASMAVDTDCCITVNINACTSNPSKFPLLWCNCNWPPCTSHSSQRKRSRCPRTHRHKRVTTHELPLAWIRTSCHWCWTSHFRGNAWSKAPNTSHTASGFSLPSSLSSAEAKALFMSSRLQPESTTSLSRSCCSGNRPCTLKRLRCWKCCLRFITCVVTSLVVQSTVWSSVDLSRTDASKIPFVSMLEVTSIWNTPHGVCGTLSRWNFTSKLLSWVIARSPSEVPSPAGTSLRVTVTVGDA